MFEVEPNADPDRVFRLPKAFAGVADPKADVDACEGAPKTDLLEDCAERLPNPPPPVDCPNAL
jgi:hypothetical protein